VRQGFHRQARIVPQFSHRNWTTKQIRIEIERASGIMVGTAGRVGSGSPLFKEHR
jgi:hypothetical protein